MGSILAAYVGLVSVSRIYLGHHWFSDIIGGGMLGIASALFATVLAPLRPGVHRGYVRGPQG